MTSPSQVWARSHRRSAETSARAYPSRNATYELKLLTVVSMVRAPRRFMAVRAWRMSDDLPYRRGEIRKTFCAAARSPTSRSSSATRSTNAAAGTTSPYTKGFCVTSNTVMATDYTVMAACSRDGPLASQVRGPLRADQGPRTRNGPWTGNGRITRNQGPKTSRRYRVSETRFWSMTEVVHAQVEHRFGAGFDEHRVPADVTERQLQHAVDTIVPVDAVRHDRPELVQRRAAGADAYSWMPKLSRRPLTSCGANRS